MKYLNIYIVNKLNILFILMRLLDNINEQNITKIMQH